MICQKCRRVKPCECKKLKPFERIDTTNYTLYNSKKWRNFAKSYKIRNPLCIECEKIGITKAVQVLDHIIPILQGGAIYEDNNLQSLCHSHHNKKSAKDRWLYK